MTSIHAKEQAIKDVFSDLYAFQIPPFQRQYRWETEQVSALINDLLTAAEGFVPNAKSRREPSPYFLGSIVLIKAETIPEAQVIDGQQRLTTLALLLSALRVGFEDEKRKKTFSQLLFEEGDNLIGTTDRCRLTLRERDHDFYEKNILLNPTLGNLPDLLKGALKESQQKIAENCDYLVKRIKELNAEVRDSLAAFLLQHTFIVVVSTTDLDSAFRIFSVLNDRGLDLTVADILKADIIGQITEKEQDKFVHQWETAEDELGTQKFADLFSQIRMIYSRSKLKKSVLEGFREAVKNATKQPKVFIDEDLIPFADALADIVGEKYESSDRQKDKLINHSVCLLNRIGDRDWMPPAILYMRDYSDVPDKLVTFFKDLERLAAGMWLIRIDENGRIERYGKLIEAILSKADLSLSISPLQLTESEKKEILAVLQGNIYEMTPKPKRTMVLLKLDETLSSGEASYEFDRITVEHVLPQNPEQIGEWLSWWPAETKRTESVHRLGNLTLLNRRQNSSAKNWEFQKKKEKYFSGKSGTSPFALTTEVLSKKEWTPDVFDERQTRFVKKLSDVWRLI